MAGINFEMVVKERLIIFAKADYMWDYWDKWNNRFGGSTNYETSSSTIWISLGIKRKIIEISLTVLSGGLAPEVENHKLLDVQPQEEKT